MFNDPFLNFLKDLGFTWWSILIAYALLSNLVDFVFLNIFNQKKYGGPKRYKKYLKKKLQWLLWPILIMGGVSATYLVVSNLTFQIADNLLNHGFQYQDLVPAILNSDLVAPFSLVLAIGISTFTLVRHFKETKLFFTKPKLFGIVRTILFDMPLAYMIVTAILRFAGQIFVLDRFYRSGWMPEQFLTPDNFFGLEWAHKLLIIQISIGLVVSITPLIMLFRKEVVEKRSKEYLSFPILYTVVISIPLIILFMDLNSMLSNIHTHFYTITLEECLAAQTATTPEEILKGLISFQNLEILSRLPDKVSLPVILGGSIGTFFVFWAGVIFDFISDQFLQGISEKIKKSLPTFWQKRKEQ